jgi:adenosylcobinamide kinase/adenosylcobinamide-phosphate guanylyltransferase
MNYEMKKHIILITGGQRSGKSRHAEELALSLSANPVYLATAHVWDEEFRERVRIHQQRRGPQWTNIEEERHLSRHDLTGRVVVIDCVTLWLTNLITPENPEYPEYPENPETPENPSSPAPTTTILAAAEAEFDAFTAREATYIFVTNEIGSGGVSPNALQRRFTDLQGWMNQYIAARADEVILMVSGIAVKIK